MPAATAHGIRRDIQGLRAVAVLFVVANHAVIPGLAGGYVGVDVFFVISGYLITGQLLGSLERTGTVSFRDFYLKRARRILPASLLVAAITALLSLIVVAPLRLQTVLGHALATVLYVPNVLFAVQQTDYLAETVPSPFQHYWSLGIEEQFYLLWPLVLLAAFTAFRRSRTGVAVVLGLVAAASLWYGVTETGVSQPTAFFTLPARGWELAAGGLFALVPLHRIPGAVRAAASWSGFALIVGVGIRYDASTVFPGAAAILPVLGALLVIAGADHARGARLVLGLRPMQFVGLISYSLYLVHWPLLVLPQEAAQWSAPLPLWASVLLGAAGIPLAWLLYRFVEVPFRVSGGRPLRARPTLAVLGSATAVTAGLLVVALAWAGARPLGGTDAVPASAAALLPAGTAWVPSNLSPDLRTAADDDGELDDLGCQQSPTQAEVLRCDFGDTASDTTVALFGDSHAARWFTAVDAVATRAGVHLITYTKSGCRSIEVAENYDDPDEASCGSWRAGVLQQLHADPPDIVLLASVFPVSATLSEAEVEQRWTDAIGQSVGRLPQASQAVMLAETPQLPVSPLYCLSAHPDDAAACAVDRSAAFNEPVLAAQHAAADAGTVPLIDLSDYFCSTDTCPAVIGPTLVYSDAHHVTDAFAATLADPLGVALQPMLEAAEA